MPGGQITRSIHDSRRSRVRGILRTRDRAVSHAAFTMVEALLASTVLAIVAAAALLPMLAAAQQSREADRLKYAVEIGQALLDEIVARPLADARVPDTVPGPSATETSRKAYVNVDAFSGFTESGQPLTDYEGATVAGTALQGFWRTANVQYVTYSGQVSGDTSSFALVTVCVYDGSRPMTTLKRLVAVEQ